MTPAGGPPVSLLAIQKDGADGHGLVFVRSDDDARSWRYTPPSRMTGASVTHPIWSPWEMTSPSSIPTKAPT